MIARGSPSRARWDDDFLYVLNEHPPEDLRSKAMECVRSCPKQAISVEEE